MSSVSHPAVTTSSVHSIVAPSPIIGTFDGKVGFFGSEGVVQADAIDAVSDTATGAELATAINALRLALKNIGITA